MNDTNNETRETRDLDLSEVWDALVKAGATVYEWTEDGVACGIQIIPIGDKILTLGDSDGYELHDESLCNEMIPVDEYNEDTAIAEASGETDG